jgi:hypothetical protein
MSEETFTHVQVEGAYQDELREIADYLGEEYPDKEIIVTSSDTEITELPPIEQMIDEITESVVDEIESGVNRSNENWGLSG